jgi:hypothetical protein
MLDAHIRSSYIQVAPEEKENVVATSTNAMQHVGFLLFHCVCIILGLNLAYIYLLF